MEFMNPSVLVVEDYADLRAAIAETLSRNDYDCDCATSAEDAIVKLAEHDYSAILIAPRLPVADDPVIHYLAENRPGEMHKVIVMSDPQTSAPGCTVLQKPFTNSELCATLKRQL
jgi:DNA-binding response OmpR family regulator